MSNTHSNLPFWGSVVHHNLDNRNKIDKHRLALSFLTCCRISGKSGLNTIQAPQFQESLGFVLNNDRL
jgi:hypothetical protein